MNRLKHILWIGLAAFVILGASAALAQDNPLPPNPGDHGNPPPTQVDPMPPPDGTPVAPPDGQPPHGDRHPQPPAPMYTASLTCSLATQLAGETQGEVAQSYSSLRASIGSSDVLAVMPSGSVFEILARSGLLRRVRVVSGAL